MDSTKHKDWVSKFEIKNPSEVALRVLKTGKRSKFIELTEEFNQENILALIEKILGGDARSISLRTGLPDFAEELWIINNYFYKF